MARAALAVSLLALVTASIALLAPAMAQETVMCRGRRSSGADINITGSSCLECQTACSDNYSCADFSWNGSSFESWLNDDACQTRPTAGMCRGRTFSGADIDITASTCLDCQAACADVSSCAEFSWDGGNYDSWSSETACSTCPAIRGYTLIVGVDHPGDNISCVALLITGSDYSAAACNNDTNCKAFVLNGNEACLKSSATIVSSEATASYCFYEKLPVAACVLLSSTGPLNATANATCYSCQTQCVGESMCDQYSWNGSKPAKYYSSDPCNDAGPVQETLCYGMTGSGQDLEFPLARTCKECQETCGSHNTCRLYSWNGGVADFYYSDRPCEQCPSMDGYVTTPAADHAGDNITCMPIIRLGADLPAAAGSCTNNTACSGFATYGNQTCLKSAVLPIQMSAATAGSCLYTKIPEANCSYFANSTVLNTTTTSCLLCGFLCRSNDRCTQYSWNGSNPASYDSNEPCDGGPAPRPEPPAWLTNCTGYTTQGTLVNISGNSCSSCRASCAATGGCSTFSFAGLPRASASNSSACNGCVGWSFDGNRAAVSGATCSACSFSCLEGINCSFYSWQGAMPTSFDNNTQCSGPAVADSCDGYDYDGSEVTITGATCTACADACRDAPSCETYSFQGSVLTDHDSKLPCIAPPATGCQAYDADAKPLNVTGTTCPDCRAACLNIGWCDFYAFNGTVRDALINCDGVEDLTGA